MKYEFYLAKHIISLLPNILLHIFVIWDPGFFISKNKTVSVTDVTL